MEQKNVSWTRCIIYVCVLTLIFGGCEKKKGRTRSSSSSRRGVSSPSAVTKPGVSGNVDDSVVVATEGDSCAELTEIKATLDQRKREVIFYFNYRVWNDYRTPITQLHIMRGGRVITTFYNGVPPRSPGRSGRATVTVPVPYGANYEIKLCMTLARSVEEAAAHAEQGGGHSRVFARIKSD